MMPWRFTLRENSHVLCKRHIKSEGTNLTCMQTSKHLLSVLSPASFLKLSGHTKQAPNPLPYSLLSQPCPDSSLCVKQRHPKSQFFRIKTHKSGFWLDSMVQLNMGNPANRAALTKGMNCSLMLWVFKVFFVLNIWP